MRQTSYEDAQGRLWAVQVPDGVADSDARLGLHLGPPPLDSLGLPSDTEVRLHNQLFYRGILTFEQAKTRRAELGAALQAAYAVDGERLLVVYHEASTNGHSEPTGPALAPKARRGKGG